MSKYMYFTKDGKVFKSPPEQPCFYLAIDNDESDIFILTKFGLVKRTSVRKYKNIRSTGIIAITLNEGDEVVSVSQASNESKLIIVTKFAKSIVFKANEVKSSERDTKGVSGMIIKKGDEALFLRGFDNPKDLVLYYITENFMIKNTLLSEYPSQKRNGMGIKAGTLNERTGLIKEVGVFHSNSSVVKGFISKNNRSIQRKISNYRIFTRPSQGMYLQGHQVLTWN